MAGRMATTLVTERKRAVGGRSITLARRLEENERAPELARMLSGARITDTVLKHARDLLRSSR